MCTYYLLPESVGMCAIFCLLATDEGVAMSEVVMRTGRTILRVSPLEHRGELEMAAALCPIGRGAASTVARITVGTGAD